MLTGTSEVTLDAPRDRAVTFDPKRIAKYQGRFPDFDGKIVSMYARGMAHPTARLVPQSPDKRRKPCVQFAPPIHVHRQPHKSWLPMKQGSRPSGIPKTTSLPK